MGSPGGLIRLVNPGDSSKINFNFAVYNESDGLQGGQFNENAAYKTPRGELIFGGPNGFNIFSPENVKPTTAIPSVAFVDFQLFQKSIKIGESVSGRVILPRSILGIEEVVLPPGQNFFSIECTALNNLTSGASSFLYKLEGLHRGWLPVDEHSRKITFTGINPGDYTLRVKALDKDRFEFSDERQLVIRVLPPFWKTKAAFALYVFGLIGILFLARKLIQQREKMKFVIEQERQEAMRMHELDMMKIRFFTNVSHEFRTPLTLILTPLDKLMRHAREPEQLTQYQLIQRNAKRLLNLVNQLLDFRKMEVQEIRFIPSEGDIINFIRDTVYSFSDLAEKKDIQLSFSSSVEVLETIFDQDKLEKILFNLLSNAFKFTPAQGSVSVMATLLVQGEEKHLQIDVTDTGIGIPEDKLGKVFERFFQHELPKTMLNQGSGIGLSITKEFVRVHQGTITVDSEVGKGSCFSVRIPVRDVLKESHAESPTESSHSVVVNPEEVELSGEDGVTHIPSLLLVEDNDDFRFYLKDNLKARFTILEAKNGQDAWKLVLSRQPDLVVSDIMMPVMNGMELCRKIKEDQRVSHIPVILLTARTSEEQKLEGFESGADEYITKPFNFEILESRIKGLIAQRLKFHKTISNPQVDVKASELKITPLDTKFIENAIKCVEKNVSSPDFSVEHLGRELGISRAYLYKKIVALTGKSPLEFIRSIRLQHAAQLLERSQLTVAEIAYQVGFNNPKYFSRYFKEEFNMLPSQYANKKKGR
jgi:signal transduction histidine kinase/DNA-binding response OmpR family regulator